MTTLEILIAARAKIDATATTTKCVSCGRFIPYRDMDPYRGPATFYFEPDNHFGPERSEWTCGKCSKESA